MPKTTKRQRKPTRRREPEGDARREQRAALQRALRAEKQIRQLVGQLRRSRAASHTSLLDLYVALGETFATERADAEPAGV